MTYNSLQGIFTTMIGFVTWPPFCTIIFYKLAKLQSQSYVAVKMLCKLLYVIQIKGFLINFLALLDIRGFGRLYLWLLIGLGLFYSQASLFLLTQ